jgi:hypothetical protein
MAQDSFPVLKIKLMQLINAEPQPLPALAKNVASVLLDELRPGRRLEMDTREIAKRVARKRNQTSEAIGALEKSSWIKVWRTKYHDSVYAFPLMDEPGKLVERYQDLVATCREASLRVRKSGHEREASVSGNPAMNAGNRDTVVSGNPGIQCPGTRTEELPSQEGRTKDSQDGSDRFEAFWAAYPRGAGSHPKTPAREAFTRALNAGADPEPIIKAAQRFADEQRAAGRIGTRYIPFPAKWLDEERWRDQEGDTRPAELDIREGEDPRWTNIKLRMCGAVGPAVVNAWLGKVAFAIAGDVVWLSAPSSYMRQAILERFHDQLLTACRAEMPSVSRLEVTVAERAADRQGAYDGRRRGKGLGAKAIEWAREAAELEREAAERERGEVIEGEAIGVIEGDAGASEDAAPSRRATAAGQ